MAGSLCSWHFSYIVWSSRSSGRVFGLSRFHDCDHSLRGFRISTITGIVILVLGAIFVIFAIAPALIPGGVPSGALEFGGKEINALELLLGAIIIIVGASIWRFAHRHVVILAAGVTLVFILSVFAVLSCLNSNLTLTSIDVTFQYGSNDQGYFGPTQQTLPTTGNNSQSNQNLTLDEGSSFNISFSLRVPSLSVGNDGIASVKATSAIQGFSFQITSVIPHLPAYFAPGSLIQLELNLVAPFYSTGQSCPPQYCYHGSYSGPIFLLITTSGD